MVYRTYIYFEVACNLVSCAVLATRYVWLLGSTASDHGWLWHQLLPLSETELEPHQQVPCMCGQLTECYCTRLFNFGVFYLFADGPSHRTAIFTVIWNHRVSMQALGRVL